MKLTLILSALLTAAPAFAAPLSIETIDVKAPLYSADATGPHRSSSARTIGLVSGSVVPEYIARLRGCVLKTEASEVASFANGESLRLVAQGIRAENERNCLEWAQSIGGDDYCAVEGKPLRALQLSATYLRTSGEKVSLSCRLLDSSDFAEMDSLVKASFGSLASFR